MINYIIILGTTKSGSGAVFNYLNGRKDLIDPINGQEYHLPQMPNGLMALEAISNNSFHPSTSDYVLCQFEEIIKKLSRSQNKWHYGMGYSETLPLFESLIKQFIEEICISEFPMRLHWRKLIHTDSKIKYFINKLKIRLGFKEKIYNSRLIVSQNDLVQAARNLHDRLFNIDLNSKPILLNQAGSGWNPIESTKFFSNRKVVLSIRDPRDQFAELKQLKKAKSVKGFISWYKEMQRRIKEINHPILLKLRFEDFINQNDKAVNQLCNHLSLNPNKKSNWVPHLSKKNISKYKTHLNSKEIDIIENSLSKYLYEK